MKLKLLFPALLAVAISAFSSATVLAQTNRSDDDVYMNGNDRETDDDRYRKDEYKEERKYKDDKYKEEREYSDDDYGYESEVKEKYKEDKYKYKEDGYKYKEEYKDDKDYDEDYSYDRNGNENYKRDDDYVCRPGHHYNCRHDRYTKPRRYYYPGGSVTIASGRHGYVVGKVWVRGHWEYSRNGHRYWVPGHYSYDKIRW
jgi:hypothetical protein